jgi:tetratricopeptide (TPR) repeat protein
MDSHLSRPSSPPSRDPAALASTFLERGIQAFDENERAMAWGWLHKALAVSMSSNDQKGLASAGWRLSMLKAQQGEIDEAVVLCRTAYEAAEAVWSRVDMAESAYILGNLLFQTSEQEEGLRMMHSAVDLYGELHDVEGQLRAWRNIGGCLRKRGSYAEAIEAWKRCLVVYGQRGELAGQARLHFAIARCWMRLEDYRQALVHNLAALGRHRHLDSPRLESDLKLLSKLRRRIKDDDVFIGDVRHIVDPANTEPENLDVVLSMLSDYEARQARIRAAAALAEATSDLSDAERELVGSTQAVAAAPAPVRPVEIAPRPSATLSTPAQVLEDRLLTSLEDSDSLSDWNEDFWEGDVDRRQWFVKQPWQIWVLAGFGTIIGMMTVMVILSVGAMIFR